MQALLIRLGRSGAAAFMAFAIAAIAHGAICVAAMPNLPAAHAAVVQA